ncbi:MAG TPA: glycosyltransferase family 2 protein [Cyclobacteriaceae bacterium]|nr:glycosyltransferase family 2 protein [Cyclobacteriaceae bacterium]
MIEMQLPPEPLISCLCITSNRMLHLKNSIRCFQGQSYPNKELIIVYQGASKSITDFIKRESKRIKIKPVFLPRKPKLSLGELRNISIENASGDYVCTWDDDDWYHTDRLKIQVAGVLNNRHAASILNYIFIFDKSNKQAYFSKQRLWEGSILYRRDIYPAIKYPPRSKSEDAIFVYDIIRHRNIFPIVHPGLYIYVFHGMNTWGTDFFKKLFESSQKLSRSCSKLISQILTGKYDVKKASRLLHSDAILSEINYLYQTKLLLAKQDNLIKGTGSKTRTRKLVR